MACENCKSTNTFKCGKWGKFDIYKCRDCGYESTDDIPLNPFRHIDRQVQQRQADLES